MCLDYFRSLMLPHPVFFCEEGVVVAFFSSCCFQLMMGVFSFCFFSSLAFWSSVVGVAFATVCFNSEGELNGCSFFSNWVMRSVITPCLMLKALYLPP